MQFAASKHAALFAADVNPVQIVMMVMAGLMILVMLLFLALFGRLFGVWLQGMLAGANVSFLSLIFMMLRRNSPKEVVRLRVMAVQAGLQIGTAQIESALLQGANVERAILAMIRARDIGQELTWDEAISEDAAERLRKML